MKLTLFISLFFLLATVSFAEQQPANIIFHKNAKHKLTEEPYDRAIYSSRNLLHFPDKSAVDVWKEFIRLLVKDPILKNTDHLDYYLANWNIWDNSSKPEVLGVTADIQMVVYPLDQEGEALVKQYLQAHEGEKILGTTVHFNKVDAFLTSIRLDMYTADKTSLMKAKKYITFEKAVDGDIWFDKLDRAIKEKNKSDFLNVLSEKMDATNVAQAAANFDQSANTYVDGQVTYLKGFWRDGTEPSFWGYSTGMDLHSK